MATATATPLSKGGSAFKLALPASPSAAAMREAAEAEVVAASAAVTREGAVAEVERQMVSGDTQFVSPLEDVLAYADYIGIDIGEDAELLWIADEALQAAEPAGWEECQDLQGGTYWYNPTTLTTMVQHPVDYHYQQFYLQMRQEKEQRRKFHSDLAAGREPAVPGSPRSARTGRAGRQGDTPRGGGGSPSMSRLDLRSVYADDVDDGAETPRGWLKRTKSLLTPRSSSANRRSPSRRDDGGGWEAVQVTGCHCHCHCRYCLLHCHLRLTHLHHLPLQVTAVVRRDERGLGMELNAYNQS